MPETPRRRGYTSLNVDSFIEYLPLARFCHSRKSAEAARRAWLTGEWVGVYETDDWSGGRSLVGAEPPAKPPADRVPEEIEVVEFLLTEVC
jgi:hypothetical protein